MSPLGKRFQRRRALLLLGMAAPLFAGAMIALAVVAYPGFDHGRQYISALGGAGAARPELFNAALLLSGVLAPLVGLGLGLAVSGLGGSRVAAWATGFAFAIAGAGMVISSRYPWPDPRHLAIQAGLGIQLAPVFLLWGLARVRNTLRLKVFLGSVFLLMVVLTLFTRHLIWPGVVNDSNVGWWERAYTIVLVGWASVAALALERILTRTELSDVRLS